MPRSIFVMCNNYPGYGGAATNAYNLIKTLRRKYINVIGIFFDNNPNNNVDPDGIGKIYQCKEYLFLYGQERAIIDRVRSIGVIPDTILCKNSSTVCYARRMYPEAKIVYLCPGLNGMVDMENLIELKISVTDVEKNAVRTCNMIVFNSEIVKTIFNQAFPNYKNKIFSKVINSSQHHTTHPEYLNEKKTLDIVIAASILTRPEKNNLFLIDILKHKEFEKYSKSIIGNDNTLFLDIPNSEIYDIIPQNQLLHIMSKSKLLIFPSIYDSNPSTVLEALYYGCAVLVSSNLDISKSLPEICVCDSFDQREWKKKASYLIDNYQNIKINYKKEICDTIFAIFD